MSHFTKRVDWWMFQEYRTCVWDLAVYRIVFAVYLILNRVPVASWLNSAPQAFFKPPLSVAALFTGFPPG